MGGNFSISNRDAGNGQNAGAMDRMNIRQTNHPNYFDPNVIIGGFMSHFVFAIPLALVVKKMLAP